MGSKVHLKRHLEADELHRLYKEAKDATARTHLQIIWLLTSGRSAQFVAEVTGYPPPPQLAECWGAVEQACKDLKV